MATPECYYCKAKEHCIAAAQPGSVLCMVNRMRYGGTPAENRSGVLPVLRTAVKGNRSETVLQ